MDWINYIYYNQQSFVNYTRNTVKGLAEQLDSTSKMTTWEKLTALDTVLAENGSMCYDRRSALYFHTQQHHPDGTITRALQGLTTLANELVKNFGENDPFLQSDGTVVGGGGGQMERYSSDL